MPLPALHNVRLSASSPERANSLRLYCNGRKRDMKISGAGESSLFPEVIICKLGSFSYPLTCYPPTPEKRQWYTRSRLNLSEKVQRGNKKEKKRNRDIKWWFKRLLIEDLPIAILTTLNYSMTTSSKEIKIMMRKEPSLKSSFLPLHFNCPTSKFGYVTIYFWYKNPKKKTFSVMIINNMHRKLTSPRYLPPALQNSISITALESGQEKELTVNNDLARSIDDEGHLHLEKEPAVFKQMGTTL
ncbi:hypothetical protein CDAR_617661 [Caerostris darwini]|uniref:Uncharacterized protein n=1 Tax=Caerostris darwini TaxID=1538125 RepID=A0AAV4T564_9ARAC|nr:hypothetical protein CDAR_617661 [Caerostris darwini]